MSRRPFIIHSRQSDRVLFSHRIDYSNFDASIRIYRILPNGNAHLYTVISHERAEEVGPEGLPALLGEVILSDSPLGDWVYPDD